MSIRGPRKGENYELSVDLNSEYRDKRKDAIKRVIASMTVGKGQSSLCSLLPAAYLISTPLLLAGILSFADVGHNNQMSAVYSLTFSKTCKPMT
jgi:hypothetical protein